MPDYDEWLKELSWRKGRYEVQAESTNGKDLARQWATLLSFAPLQAEIDRKCSGEKIGSDRLNLVETLLLFLVSSSSS